MKEKITIEKEVYEAVLRNSVQINDLEKENQQLKELLKECREELKPFIDFFTKKPTFASLITKIDNAIGEKK